MNRPTLPQVVRGVAALAVITILGSSYGVPGLLAGAVTALALTMLPTPYGFALGQLAVAVLAPPRLPALITSPGVIGVECALILALWSDLTHARNQATLPVALAATLLLGGITISTYAETELLWLTGGVLLASIVTIAYALQRYTLVFILDEVPA